MATEKKNGYVLRGERSRKKILDGAKEVFLEKGFKEATVTLIAERANTGYGTVYSHFPAGKEEVLLNIMEDIMGDFYGVASVTYTPKNKEEAFAFTYQNVVNFLHLATVHQQWLALFYEAFGQSDLLRTRWEEITERFIVRISKNVDIVREMGLIRNPDYDSRVVAGALYYPGQHYLWEIALGRVTKDYKEIASDIAEVYTYGLFQ
ncbi:TetR/AcrR family transcriptional regulator [Planomicrobium sp. YIM 101495]|uniref:TetR/AcrR family transcriptional regulator n=1 Tax=Planomicrobium sp. YIM 101495 TaxID=2665160 RepID=UPI0012B8B752|nr:TetR family transcriptional regulator [Planomicrobium sp. YIM 101495]